MFATLKKYFSPCINHDEKLSFLQIVKPLYVVLSAFGLFPQAIEFPDGKQDRTLALKPIRINWACTWLMILIVHIFLVVHLLELSVARKDYLVTEDAIPAANYIFDLVMRALFCTVCYFRVIRDRRLYIAILNAMADCWDRLAKGERKLILGRLRVQVNCAVLGSLLAATLLLNAVTYTGNSYNWKLTLIGLTLVLPELIQFALIAFYFVMILMLVTLLKNIEKQFTKYLLVRNHVRYDSYKPDLRLDISMAKIRDVYMKTMRIKRLINKAFQAPIMVSLLVSFHELVSIPHMIYHGLTFKSHFATHEVIEGSCWVLSPLIKMYALAHSGSLLKSQVNKITLAIHRIPITGSQDLEIFLEVQHFSSLMTFENAEITVYGYVSLDTTLMFNVVASAVTYLIIMIQFDKSE